MAIWKREMKQMVVTGTNGGISKIVCVGMRDVLIENKAQNMH